MYGETKSNNNNKKTENDNNKKRKIENEREFYLYSLFLSKQYKREEKLNHSFVIGKWSDKVFFKVFEIFNIYVKMLNNIIQEIIYSPINFTLMLIISFLIYKIIRDRFGVLSSSGVQKPPEPQLPRLRRDFTVAELKQYDGTQPDGRILVAVNGFVFDVTKAKGFYGPGNIIL